MDVEWLKSRKSELGLKDGDLAGPMGVERSVANKIANGKVALNARRADAVADVLRVSRDEVLYRFGITDHAPTPSPHLPVPTSTDTVEIQKLDLSLSMGPGTLIDDWVEAEPVSFDLAFIRGITRTPSDRLRLVTGIGDSMYPTLNWGDVIMVDTTDRMLARQDAIYWVSVHGAAGIKRLRNIGKGRILVISDNQAVADQEVEADDLRIEGRAIWFARGL